MAETDVSGLWSGAYSYRRLLATVSFEARLDEMRGAVSGVVEELSDLVHPPRRVTATLYGRRDVCTVSWIKVYDEPTLPGYDQPVAYLGVVSADGTEIRGEWRLPGGFSGTFLMIRAASLQAERAREAASGATG